MPDRTRCPACKVRDKHWSHYLCVICWRQLPNATQTALYRHDSVAILRLIKLHRALKDGIALNQIHIGVKVTT
jgi:DNA-directed RNA polymerase subunit RPC12/RpoP